MWTLAYRKKTANRFQRVTNWQGTWCQARELAGEFAKQNPNLQVYYVPTAATECGEDAGNILVDSGRRVRITETGSLGDDLISRAPDADSARDRWNAVAA